LALDCPSTTYTFRADNPDYERPRYTDSSGTYQVYTKVALVNNRTEVPGNRYNGFYYTSDGLQCPDFKYAERACHQYDG
jgi:hypothetical protein